MATKQPRSSFTASMRTMSINGEKQTAGVGVSVAGYSKSLDELDALLNGAQLRVELKVQPNKTEDIDDQSGTQTTISGTEAAQEFKGLGECGGFARRGDFIQFRLKFNNTAVDCEALASISGKTCKMKLVRVGDADADAEDMAEPDGE